MVFAIGAVRNSLAVKSDGAPINALLGPRGSLVRTMIGLMPAGRQGGGTSIAVCVQDVSLKSGSR